MPYRNRIEINAKPLRFRIANYDRKTVDVLNAPSQTPIHLAFSSDWSRLERIHAVTMVNAQTLRGTYTIPISPVLAKPPFAIMFRKGLLSSRIYDTQTHRSKYYRGPTIGFIDGVIEQRHRVYRTAREAIYLTQEPQVQATSTSSNETYSNTKWDFVVISFMRDETQNHG